jgi:hypothetical protein
MPPFVFSGLGVENPDFTMQVSEYGYSDSMLDQRAQFMGREYLSGEWAGAIYYEGGSLPAMTRWLTPRFVFPDFVTPLPHFAPVDENRLFTVQPLRNMYGFRVFESEIWNADLKIGMEYQTVDFGEPLSGRLSLGLTPQSAGGVGEFLPSTQYGFMQTYTIENTTDSTLNNVRFSQFLHTLHGDWAVYDARDHGGGMVDYKYGITMQGESFGFDMLTYKTVKHTDTVSMKFSHMPSGVEVGPFGFKLNGDHQTGEPAEGVHKSVIANSLNGTDWFDPNEAIEEENAWVGGALAFDLGSLEPGATVSLSMMLAINTSYDELDLPPINMKIHDVRLADGKFTIDFEETTMNPLVGFSLLESETGAEPLEQWSQVPVPNEINADGIPNLRRFERPVDTTMRPNLLFYIRPSIINEE